MRKLRAIARLGKNLIRSVARALSGKPLTISHLVGQTIGRDDVVLAEAMLATSGVWHDAKPVEEFQREFAAWNGSRGAWAFSSGRAALSACLSALDLEPGDEVLLPGYTCVVVPNAVHYAGLNPVYADIELETYGLDASCLEKHISARSRAIVLQHLYGLVCRDYEKIINIAHKYNLVVIEDCAHATGACWKDVAVGNLGDFAFYSFERSKIMTTVMGGMAVTNNEQYSEKLERIHSKAGEQEDRRIEQLLAAVPYLYGTFVHDSRWFQADVANIRYGWARFDSTDSAEMKQKQPADYIRRMAGAQARIGLNQLAKLDSCNAQRRNNAKIWDNWCGENGYPGAGVVQDSEPVFLRYPTLVEPEQKVDVAWAARELGVELGRWFLGKLHPLDMDMGGCPNADEAVARCVNFPCPPNVELELP